MVLFLLCQVQLLLAQDVTGSWHGSIPLAGKQLDMTFNISKSDTGLLSTLDIPMQGLAGFKATGTHLEDSLLSIQFPEFDLSYEGRIASGDTILGHMTQHGMKTVLNLKRGTLTMTRPQNPVGKLPYTSKEIAFRTTGNLTLKGTFTLPETRDFPVVVLIQGSGPQNRDGAMFGHKPGLVLSDYLTRQGIGVLRFDERGTGTSEGTYASTSIATQVEDVQAAIHFLQQEGVKNIGLVGHSIGGIVASKVAAINSDIDFMILLAAPGLDGDVLMLQQKANLEKMRGLTEAQITQGQLFLKGAYHIITHTHLEGKALSDSLNAFYSNNYGAMVPEKERTKLVESLSASELVSLIRSKPGADLKQVHCPVLAINGTKDFQVSASENLEAIKKALNAGGNIRVETHAMIGLNHLLQEADTGDITEYAQIEQTLSPKVLEMIAQWIKKL